MSLPRFVWIIRTWCSVDSFWEHVREHKEYDVSYTRAELVLEEIERIILKEQSEWNDICETTSETSEKEITYEKPSLEQLKMRPFHKFLSISNSKSEFMQSWYVERLSIVDA